MVVIGFDYKYILITRQAKRKAPCIMQLLY